MPAGAASTGSNVWAPRRHRDQKLVGKLKDNGIMRFAGAH